MGPDEPLVVAEGEGTVKYHSAPILTLIWKETVPGGEFDWGGRLPKGNGGAQRSPPGGWTSPTECIGRRGLDCKGDIPRRWETRAK